MTRALDNITSVTTAADPRLSRIFVTGYLSAAIFILFEQTRFLSSKGWHQVVEQTPGGQPVLGGSLVLFGVVGALTFSRGEKWVRASPYLGGGAWCLLVGLSFLISTVRDVNGGTPGLVFYPVFGLVMILHGLDHVFPPKQHQPHRLRDALGSLWTAVRRW